MDPSRAGLRLLTVSCLLLLIPALGAAGEQGAATLELTPGGEARELSVEFERGGGEHGAVELFDG